MTTDTPWGLHEIEPTNFVALLPGVEAPKMAVIGEAFLRATGVREGATWEAFEREPYMEWAARLRLPGVPPVGVWVQPAEPLEEGELGDRDAESCPWAIGCCAVMDEHDPLTQYIGLMQMLGSALPEARAVLDLNCGRWYVGDERRLAFDDPLDEAPADVMWVIQAASDAQGSESSTCWLHTHGLWRCGRPDLEMLQVPSTLAAAAAELLNTVAAIMVEQGTPPPCTPLRVGEPLTVQLVPWRAAAETLDPASPGSIANRAELFGDAHGDARAVICAVDEGGRFHWPRQAVEAIERSEAVLEQTARETQRQSKQARAGWPLLRRAAAAAAGDDSVVVLVKSAQTGPAAEGETADREHLWHEVSAVEEDGAHGVLVDTPRLIEGLQAGAHRRIERSTVSGWQVMTKREVFDQGTTQALEHWLDRRAAGAAAP